MTFNLILAAKITGVHGIKGLVKLQCHIENLDLLTGGQPLLDKNGNPSFTVETAQVHGNAVLAKLKGVADRTKAEKLRGRELYISRDSLPETGADEIYYADLIGCTAVADGETIGEIAQIVNYGASDLLEIRKPDGALVYVPFTEEFVPAIDIEAGEITINPVPGLLD